MINRGINESAGMLIINPNARNTAKIGLNNDNFFKGNVHYVGSEIRAIILNKMMVAPQDNVCVIGGESIAVEAALTAVEGSVIAVEYNRADRMTMEENVDHFGLQNITIIDHVDEDTMKDLPVPNLVFMVASASMDKELSLLTRLNPNVNVVIYSLNFWEMFVYLKNHNIRFVQHCLCACVVYGKIKVSMAVHWRHRHHCYVYRKISLIIVRQVPEKHWNKTAQSFVTQFYFITYHVPCILSKMLPGRILFYHMNRTIAQKASDFYIFQFIFALCKSLVQKDWKTVVGTVINPVTAFYHFYRFLRRSEFFFVFTAIVHFSPFHH